MIEKSVNETAKLTNVLERSIEKSANETSKLTSFLQRSIDKSANVTAKLTNVLEQSFQHPDYCGLRHEFGLEAGSKLWFNHRRTQGQRGKVYKVFTNEGEQ